MATTHTTQLARGGQFSGWKMWILIAGAVIFVATLAGRDIFSDSAELIREQASVHNLLEGIDEGGPEAASAAGAASGTAAFEIPRNLLEGIDQNFVAGSATAGLGGYTAYKVAQQIGELVAAPVVPSDYTFNKVEQARDFQGSADPVVLSSAAVNTNSVLSVSEAKLGSLEGNYQPMTRASVSEESALVNSAKAAAIEGSYEANGGPSFAEDSALTNEQKAAQVEGGGSSGSGNDANPHTRNLVEGP